MYSDLAAVHTCTVQMHEYAVHSWAFEDTFKQLLCQLNVAYSHLHCTLTVIEH